MNTRFIIVLFLTSSQISRRVAEALQRDHNLRRRGLRKRQLRAHAVREEGPLAARIPVERRRRLLRVLVRPARSPGQGSVDFTATGW